ncbi:MAG: carbohydrate ABC transporter permease [Clostridiales bacterium]|nr:carbohydrate ABC transporter permease [Clostridiales bacterium]
MTVKKKKLVGNIAYHCVAIIFAFIIMFPFFWMLSTSLKGNGALLTIPIEILPKAPTLDAYEKLFRTPSFVKSIFNSLYVAIFSTAVQLITSSMAAYALTKIKFKGREALFKGFIATMMIPFQVIFIPLFIVMSKMNLTNNLSALVLLHLFAPVAIFMLRQKMMTIDDAYIEAATIDGASAFQIYRKIILPLCSGTLATLAVMAFMSSWNDYLIPLVMLSDQEKYTLPLVLNGLEGQFLGEYNLMMAGSLISIIPILILYICMQKYFKEGLQVGGVKG